MDRSHFPLASATHSWYNNKVPRVMLHEANLGGGGRSASPAELSEKQKGRLESQTPFLLFHRGIRRYFRTGVSQPSVSGFSPLITLKNSFCSFSVIGPRLPEPIVIRSTERIGLTSAAVPVKNTSSAM